MWCVFLVWTAVYALGRARITRMTTTTLLLLLDRTAATVVRRKSAGRFGVDHDAAVVVVVEHFIGESRPPSINSPGPFRRVPVAKIAYHWIFRKPFYPLLPLNQTKEREREKSTRHYISHYYHTRPRLTTVPRDPRYNWVTLDISYPAVTRALQQHRAWYTWKKFDNEGMTGANVW